MPSFFHDASYRVPNQKQGPLAPSAPDGATLPLRPEFRPTSLGTALLGGRGLPPALSARKAALPRAFEGPLLSPPDVPPERPAG